MNTNICTYLETCGGQSSDLYLNVVHFFNTSFNWTFKLVTAVLLHSCLIHVVLFGNSVSDEEKKFFIIDTWKSVALGPPLESLSEASRVAETIKRYR